ncbi:trypsin-like serine protease [Emydomyces testavorans]|uniref:Trypsin-like serine protease n=1 Tax=Emydomyces testavorans TaxID=2070801 RepID=A0AAF0DFF3_9EURO|nr:trypsin-like serine protease [Emydomyces testavorans]
MAKLLAIVVALAMPAVSMAAAVGRPGHSPSPGALQIVGGTEAKPGQFPSILALTINNAKACGAVLLNTKTALTAAHCVERLKSERVEVRAGTNIWNSGGTQVHVSKVIMHPDYEKGAESNNDIAVLHLAAPIEKSSLISYANLPAQGSDPAPGTNGTAAGWGDTESGGSSPDNLLYVTVSVTERSKCKALHTEVKGVITDSMVCAGTVGKDACQGDSGGPFYDAATGALVGLVSWGNGCGTKYGGVYTRVGAFVDWIKTNSLTA